MSQLVALEGDYQTLYLAVFLSSLLSLEGLALLVYVYDEDVRWLVLLMSANLTGGRGCNSLARLTMISGNRISRYKATCR